MRIGLDLTPLSGPLSGIGLFVQRLAAAIAEAPDAEIAPIALTGRSRSELNGHLPPNMAPVVRSFPAGPLLRIWEHVDLPRASDLFGPMDLVHGTNFYCPPAGRGRPELVTIHDTGPWLRPDDVSPTARRFPALAQRALARGAHVHALSHTAGAEIAELLDIPDDRMHPVPLAVDPVLEVALQGRLQASLADRPFILAIGTIEPRKQFPELVTALRPLLSDRPELHLVIAGGPGQDSGRLASAIDPLGKTGMRIHRAGFVSDSERHALLGAASVVVSAAKSEGFGMVPLEAMAAGTAVVATNGGAQPEICGDAAILVPVGDWESLVEAVETSLDDIDPTRLALGRQRAASYNWRATTDALLVLYRTLIG